MHGLIIGQTQSGKTRLAKYIAEQFLANGVNVIVLDPFNDNYPCTFTTKDKEIFLSVAFKSKSCLLIVDESGASIGKHDENANKLATQGRHWGHSTLFLCQKSTQVAPIVRDQCAVLYAFKCGYKTSKDLAEEFVEPELLNLPDLPRGHYICKNRVMRRGEFITAKLF